MVVIVGILSVISFGYYRTLRSDSEARVCETNLKALQAALISCVMEEGVPACLTAIPQKYINRAYAKLLNEKGAWRIKLAFFILGPEDEGVAYAAPFVSNIARGDTKLLTCAADKTPPPGGTSYGYNVVLDDVAAEADPQTQKELFQKLPADLILIGDCDADKFNTSLSDTELPLTKRHKRYGIIGSPDTYAFAATKIFKEGKGAHLKKIIASPATDANEACHAAYQKCLTDCYNNNLANDALRLSCYDGCESGSLGAVCSGQYE